MKAAAFLIALRRRTHAISTYPDPLGGAWRFLEENGETGEGRILRRIIETLATGGGEYSESEVYLHSDKMLAIVAALFEARERGFYTEEEWRH